MLLPKIEAPITPGSISLPYETCNTNSLNRQLMRSMRQMRGHAAFELTIDGSEERAAFLKNFAGLTEDDLGYEEKLSAALDGLLLSIMDSIDETVAIYPDEDQNILKVIAAKQLKRVLANGLKDVIEEADAQIQELRKEAEAA